MTSAQGILPAMAVYAGGILGMGLPTLFGCRNVNLTDIMKTDNAYLSAGC